MRRSSENASIFPICRRFERQIILKSRTGQTGCRVSSGVSASMLWGNTAGRAVRQGQSVSFAGMVNYRNLPHDSQTDPAPPSFLRASSRDGVRFQADSPRRAPSVAFLGENRTRRVQGTFALWHESLSCYRLQPTGPTNPDTKSATVAPITLLQLLEEEPLDAQKLISNLFNQPQHGNVSFRTTYASIVPMKTALACDDTTKCKRPILSKLPSRLFFASSSTAALTVLAPSNFLAFVRIGIPRSATHSAPKYTKNRRSGIPSPSDSSKS
jgi:hypothetical protein